MIARRRRDVGAESIDVKPTSLQANQPDDAWQILGLVNEWIRFADGKAGAVLATSGVIGGVLYNLVSEHQSLPGPTVLVATACGVFAGLAVLFSALALLPRLNLRFWRADDPTSPLYFDHVARAHLNDPLPYVEIVSRISRDSESLVKEIALQIHANSVVARRKYRQTTRAVACLVLALALLGATAYLLLHT